MIKKTLDLQCGPKTTSENPILHFLFSTVYFIVNYIIRINNMSEWSKKKNVSNFLKSVFVPPFVLKRTYYALVQSLDFVFEVH